MRSIKIWLWNVKNDYTCPSFKSMFYTFSIACNAGDLGLIPGLGRSSGEGKGYPLQCSDLESSVDCIVHGVAKSWTRLSNFHLHSCAMQSNAPWQVPWLGGQRPAAEEKQREESLQQGLEQKNGPQGPHDWKVFPIFCPPSLHSGTFTHLLHRTASLFHKHSARMHLPEWPAVPWGSPTRTSTSPWAETSSYTLRHAGYMCRMEADFFTLYRVDPAAAPPYLAPDCPDLRGSSERCSQHSGVCHQSLFGSKLVARNLNLALPNFILWVQTVWCSVDLLLICFMCSSVWTAICLLTPPLVSGSRPQMASWLSSCLGKQTQARWLWSSAPSRRLINPEMGHLKVVFPICQIFHSWRWYSSEVRQFRLGEGWVGR